MPLKGVSNLPNAQRSSAKSSATTPHHEHHASQRTKPSKASGVAPPPVMPFMQQMQLLQALEGGRIEDHIRRHHKHLGETSLEEARNRNFKDDRNRDMKETRGYTVTDERGMMWFDEEEEWEFKELLPKAGDSAVAPPIVVQKPTGIRKLFGTSKKPSYVITGWETFDQSGEYSPETDDDSNGGISPGVTGKIGFAYPPDSNAILDKNFRHNISSFQSLPHVPQNAGALKLPPPPQPSNTSRRKHPVVTHTIPKTRPPTSSSQAAVKTMSHHQLKKEFLAQAFTPSVSLPATRSHTPTSNHSQISLPPASRSQTSLALPSSSSARSVSPFAKLRSRKVSLSGAKQQ